MYVLVVIDLKIWLDNCKKNKNAQPMKLFLYLQKENQI